MSAPVWNEKTRGGNYGPFTGGPNGDAEESDRHMFFIFFGCFITLMLSIAVNSHSKTAATAAQNQYRQHFFGGKSTKTIVLFGTLFSTIFSVYTVIGVPAETTLAGYFSLRWGVSATAIVASATIIAPRVFRVSASRNYDSPFDSVTDCYNNRLLTITVALLGCASVMVYLVAQFFTLKLLIPPLSGGMMDSNVTVWFIAAIILVSEILGGFDAVTLTDAVQSIIMVMSLIAVPATAGYYFGAGAGAGDSFEAYCDNYQVIDCASNSYLQNRWNGPAKCTQTTTTNNALAARIGCIGQSDRADLVTYPGNGMAQWFRSFVVYQSEQTMGISSSGFPTCGDGLGKAALRFDRTNPAVNYIAIAYSQGMDKNAAMDYCSLCQSGTSINSGVCGIQNPDMSCADQESYASRALGDMITETYKCRVALAPACDSDFTSIDRDVATKIATAYNVFTEEQVLGLIASPPQGNDCLGGSWEYDGTPAAYGSPLKYDGKVAGDTPATAGTGGTQSCQEAFNNLVLVKGPNADAGSTACEAVVSGLAADPPVTRAAAATSVNINFGTDTSSYFSHSALQMFNWMFMSLSLLFNPHWLMRTMAAQSDHAVKGAMTILAFSSLLTTFTGVFLGITIAANLIPLNAPATSLAGGAGDAYGMLLADFMDRGGFPEVVACVMGLGAIAAMMSTVDSAILSVSNILSMDVLHQWLFKAKPTWETPKTLSRFGTAVSVFSVTMTVSIALYHPDLTNDPDVYGRLFEFQAALLWLCVPSLVSGCFFDSVKGWSCFAGIVVGTMTWLLMEYARDIKFFGSPYAFVEGTASASTTANGFEAGRPQSPVVLTYGIAAYNWAAIANIVTVAFCSQILKLGNTSPLFEIPGRKKFGEEPLTGSMAKAIFDEHGDGIAREPIRDKWSQLCLAIALFGVVFALPWGFAEDNGPNSGCDVFSYGAWEATYGGAMALPPGPQKDATLAALNNGFESGYIYNGLDKYPTFDASGNDDHCNAFLGAAPGLDGLLADPQIGIYSTPKCSKGSGNKCYGHTDLIGGVPDWAITLSIMYAVSLCLLAIVWQRWICSDDKEQESAASSDDSMGFSESQLVVNVAFSD